MTQDPGSELILLLRELREGPRPSFSPGFAARVVARMRTERMESVSVAEIFLSLFKRASPFALSLAVVLLVANATLLRSPQQNTLEAALGLTPITLEAIYDVEGALYEG
jgi:hypothetical protein